MVMHVTMNQVKLIKCAMDALLSEASHDDSKDAIMFDMMTGISKKCNRVLHQQAKSQGENND